ncbi:unnamed protein product [Caenorhabditis bovis]|uniref:GLD-3 KH5 domain-containing protein n=1 Tax=Caenorhabditis bovis TaxID=2654633 RepID=A0A8S1ETJ9_9PELO|nr:unnamed protein product [Caenorhabditis bovis]
MANDMIASRNLALTKTVADLITEPSNFFHQNQQSAMMLSDFQSRKMHSYETMRKAAVKQKRMKNEELPAKIPMLEVNPLKITLSMEVEAQYYSIMMRRGDDKEDISTIMYKTNTLIQLPDRPDDENPTPYVQQVTITGSYREVERARILIRENCPMFIYLEIRKSELVLDHLLSLIQSESISLKNVTIEFHSEMTNEGEPIPYLRLICCSKHEEYLLNACEELGRIVFNGNIPERAFVYNCDIATYHVEHIVGKPEKNIWLMGFIEDATNTKISCPPYHRDEYKQCMFPITIRGDLKGVLRARHCLLELFPVTVCFNLNDTDMAHSVDSAYRCMETYHQDVKVCMRIAPSLMEPSELLADEVQQHCVTLRTKEFNLKALYMLYGQLLKKELNVDPPKPECFENSMWVREHQLDKNVMSFKLPCRGEAPLPDKHNRVSTRSQLNSTSHKQRNSQPQQPIQQQLQENTTIPLNTVYLQQQMKQPAPGVIRYPPNTFEGPEGAIAQAMPSAQVMHFNPQAFHMFQQRLALTGKMGQNYSAKPPPNMAPAFMAQPQQQQQSNLMMTTVVPHAPFYYVQDQNFVVPVPIPYTDEMLRFFKQGLPPGSPIVSVAEPQQMHPQQQQRDSSQSRAPSNSNPNTRSNPAIRPQLIPPLFSSASTASSYRTRQFESVKEDEISNRQDSHSRRSSIGDEPTAGSCDGYQSDRAYYRHRMSPQENIPSHANNGDPHYKWGQSSNRVGGDMHYGRKTQKFQANGKSFVKNPSYGDGMHHGNSNSQSAPNIEHHYFSGNHVLKLKSKDPNPIDSSMDCDRLFTQDNSQTEDRPYSPRKYFPSQSQNGGPAFDYNARSRTGSVSQVEREDARAITKTVLEPRYKMDKNCPKIQLDYKVKAAEQGHASRNEGASYAHIAAESINGDNKIIDFIKKVQEQTEINGHTANIPLGSMNRTYADILKEKERERADRNFERSESEDMVRTSQQIL